MPKCKTSSVDISKFSKLFKDDDGNELILTEGQSQIFKVILNREPKRNVAITCTQYGKSLTCALGMVIRASSVPNDKWCIIGATDKKAKIMMNYVIQHIFDNTLFYSQLIADTSLERLRTERSKERLTFRRGGEIYILSAQARNRKAVINALIGYGNKNIIVDDSGLIDNDLYAMIKRMLGGRKDSFLLETGNPFKRNHFFKALHSSRYNKIVIDYEQALREGRYTQDFIDEMREEAFFDVLYSCKFPEANEIDEYGWTVLIPIEDIEKRFVNELPKLTTNKILGVDVARGGNFNTYVLRTKEVAWLKSKDRNNDTMSTVGRIEQVMTEENVNPSDVYIDMVGLGGGIVDRLRERKIYVNGVNEGERADDSSRYSNRRAEMNWRMKKWLEEGGKLLRNDDFYQIADNKYKPDSSGKVKMMSKEELRLNGISSPDISDGLSLTFAKDYVQAVKMSGLQITGIGQVESAGIYR
jgi:hypothetical protein